MECPACQARDEPRPVGFTWWGGLIGAKLLNHVECVACGARFNGKTGRSNTGAIALYSIVIGAIAFGLMYAVLSR